MVAHKKFGRSSTAAFNEAERILPWDQLHQEKKRKCEGCLAALGSTCWVKAKTLPSNGECNVSDAAYSKWMRNKEG